MIISHDPAEHVLRGHVPIDVEAFQSIKDRLELLYYTVASLRTVISEPLIAQGDYLESRCFPTFFHIKLQQHIL